MNVHKLDCYKALLSIEFEKKDLFKTLYLLIYFPFSIQTTLQNFYKLLTAIIVFIFINLSYAETAQEKGLKIAIEADRRDKGWHDSQAKLNMLLKNRQGQKSKRTLRLKALEVEGDGDKSMTIFDTPKDVAGTVFLSFTHINKNDDQWLYLPALKRVKRISSRNKSGPFMGSEFSYEDMSSQEIEKYNYKYLRDEKYNNLDCFVVERIPVDKNSGYTKQITWIDKKEYRAQKVVFYDRKDSLLKTLKFYEYKKYLDKYWRANRLEMINSQNNKSTILLWDNYQFKTGLSAKDFNKRMLKRVR